uniref:Putative T5 A1-like protein n=1 Tax=uncultured marine virus TaxID=186617 RepID=A0A0F7LA78_9VIRU|nr:putative T5 A1-like protein [uncultured marine virus]
MRETPCDTIKIESTLIMKYIVTNIQFNAGVNHNLLRNILAFAKEHGVDGLLTFTQNGSYRDEDVIAKEVFEAGFVTIDSQSLNQNLRLKDMKILAQQINPMTGMTTKLSRDYSYIMPSAKIRYLSVANTSTKPRAFMTTGNLTKPNYKLQTAQGRKANEQHQYGFVFVEVTGNKKFTTYQVEATKKGDFHYLNERYVSGKKVMVQPEAIVLGDLHIGDTSKRAYAQSLDVIEELNPKLVVIHDLFNGHSINPHEQDHLIASLRNLKQHRHSLDKELKLVYREVMNLSERFPEIQFLVAESNHDIFLERYIDGKRFMEHPQNFLHAIAMIPEILGGKKPTLQIGLELIGELPENFHFAMEDEEHRVRGVELAYHGHRGLNGSRGSSASFDRYNFRMISGHEHSPKLYANGMVVGTLTRLRLPYTKGAGGWMHCNGILYRDGKYGLMPFVI